jgi:hypothetical protein
MNRLAAIALGVLVLAIGACSREPAAVKDLQLLSRALSDPREYTSAVAQLEQNPKGARRALSEQSAAPGTRRALLLSLIEDRVRKPGRYAAWDGTVKRQADRPLTDLVNDRHTGFWSEKLLFDDPTSATAAARHLVAIDSERSREALALRARDTQRDPDESTRIGTEGLARAGDFESFVAALDNWFAAEDAHAATRDRAIGQLRHAAALLPGKAKGAAEQSLLMQIDKPELSIAERRARLVLLESVVRPGAVPRLAKMRRSMPAPLRAEMDAVLVAALSRDARLSRLGEPEEDRP